MNSRTPPVGLPPHRLALNQGDVNRSADLPVVRFADLNLYCRIDVRYLYKRLRTAANRASEHFRDPDRVVAEAVATINHPVLSEHHRQMTSTSQTPRSDIDS